MLYCAQCPGSSFTTREDLATHYKTSSQWHPYCWKCDVDFDDAERFDKHLLANHNPYTCFYCSLRFGSEGAMEQHVLAKHARFRCEVCDSGFETEIGRNRHYRDSSAHPTCSKCGCGCEDCESLRKHERDTHSQLACPPPSGQSVYVDGLDGHYLESPNYLTCSYCLVAFEDRFSCEEHIDSVHSGLQTCSLADRGVVTPEYLYMGSSDYRGDGSNDMECDRGSGDVGEDVHRPFIHNMLSSIELTDRSEKMQWSDFDGQSSTDVELQSEYESATEEDDSEQYLEFSEYRLHTDSPAWAALFPLPDSPEVVTMILHTINSDSLPSVFNNSVISPKASSQNSLETSDSPCILSAQEYPMLDVHPCASYSVPQVEANEFDGDTSDPPTGTRTPDEGSSSGMASSVGSPHFEEYPELPSSPSSLISSGWSYPDPPGASEVVPAHHPRHSPLGASHASKAPNVASSSILASALSPQEQSIPFQFSDSIFDQTLSDDGTEVDATWDSENGPTPLLCNAPVCNPIQLLHCRLCLRESCDDLTATMCGHIFCNSCITKSVVANPRCPVCKAPTLLYSLFRIDLSV